MSAFLLYILTALALILVIEGMFYALFPDLVRKMMQTAIDMPIEQLRVYGSFMAISGFIFVWFLKLFAS